MYASYIHIYLSVIICQSFLGYGWYFVPTSLFVMSDFIWVEVCRCSTYCQSFCSFTDASVLLCQETVVKSTTTIITDCCNFWSLLQNKSLNLEDRNVMNSSHSVSAEVWVTPRITICHQGLFYYYVPLVTWPRISGSCTL